MATGPAMRSLLTAIGVFLACVVLAFPARGAGASPETELLQNGSFEQDTDGTVSLTSGGAGIWDREIYEFKTPLRVWTPSA